VEAKHDLLIYAIGSPAGLQAADERLKCMGIQAELEKELNTAFTDREDDPHHAAPGGGGARGDNGAARVANPPAPSQPRPHHAGSPGGETIG